MKHYRCPVCGWLGLQYSPDVDLYGSFDICPCCGTEFGLDVYPGGPYRLEARLERLRRVWVGRGAKWWSSYGCPPVDLDWRKNLRAIGVNPDTCKPLNPGE